MACHPVQPGLPGSCQIAAEKLDLGRTAKRAAMPTRNQNGDDKRRYRVTTYRTLLIAPRRVPPRQEGPQAQPGISQCIGVSNRFSLALSEFHR